ncbi:MULTISPECIES: hypothetical protein [Sphingobacterium]|uniref:hypothetical protein n=1 Tax=Sphingobacterium TaxID=28453 RepID=UPI00257B4925|nr:MULTISPECIES: hypothetical protein [Sphingobacterium]
MEDIIGLGSEKTHKSQEFRLTYKGQDYQLVLLEKSLSKNSTEVKILLDGIVQKLVKREKGWFFENIKSDHLFANEIWRNISLRFRI